ncbi:SDR family oxidoreductase [Phenylobacterium sp. LjRoot219]|uniref:SDR family NAD(P)-dependent oxidoreductase n=1 Tax=Phenylobacterium sp. LjRoot219 TaxID=3342283 RepID=UPI003ED17372
MTGKELPKGVAVVTGAAGGMGSATAQQLLAAGWRQLLLCDLDAGRLEAVAAPLRDGGAEAQILAGDVANPAFPARLLEALAGRALGALVHTAGISPNMGSAERILAVNLDATVRLVEAVRPRMAKGAAAVLFASNSAYFPMPTEAAQAFTQPLPPEGSAALLHLAPSPELAYPLSKLGVRALVKREAKSFGERGARLVSMSPGAIDTPMTRGELPNSEVARRMVETSASGRMGRAEELAAVAVFLCSPGASFVTAVDWLVDGGHTAAMGF